MADPAERPGPHRWAQLAFLLAWASVLNGALYLLYGLLSGQLRFRVIPQRDQVRHFGASVWEHLTLRFPQGDEAKRYNVIQKLTYAVVLFVLLPVQVDGTASIAYGLNRNLIPMVYSAPYCALRVSEAVRWGPDLSPG